MDTTTYPPVPLPRAEYQKARAATSGISGVYFAWEDGELQYIGSSADIGKRISQSHHAVNKHQLFSWLEIPEKDLLYAEAYYIGKTKPPRNFGKQKDKQNTPKAETNIARVKLTNEQLQTLAELSPDLPVAHIVKSLALVAAKIVKKYDIGPLFANPDCWTANHREEFDKAMREEFNSYC